MYSDRTRRCPAAEKRQHGLTSSLVARCLLLSLAGQHARSIGGESLDSSKRAMHASDIAADKSNIGSSSLSYITFLLLPSYIQLSCQALRGVSRCTVSCRLHCCCLSAYNKSHLSHPSQYELLCSHLTQLSLLISHHSHN